MVDVGSFLFHVVGMNSGKFWGHKKTQPAAGSWEDEKQGFPRLKESFVKMTPTEQKKERILLLRASLSDRLFGHVAKKSLLVLEEVMNNKKP